MPRCRNAGNRACYAREAGDSRDGAGAPPEEPITLDQGGHGMRKRLTGHQAQNRVYALALSFGLATGLASLDAAKPAQAAEFTLKFGISSAEDAEHNIARTIKEVVEAKSKGRIEVQIYPRGQLGSQSATIQGVQTGTVEGFMTPGDFYAGIDPRMGVLSFPFLFKDRAHANRTLADPALAQRLASLLEPKGIIGCGQVATADVRYMTRNPIHKLADFEGKKLRINGTDAEKERFRRVGATSIPMNLADMLTALQNKTIDGSGSGMTIWVNFNLETVSKELLQIEDTLIVAYCALSKRWLDTLPPDLRDIVIAETRAVFPRSVKITDEFAASLTKKWEDRGGKINRLSDTEVKIVRDKFATVGTTITEGKPELRAFYNELKTASEKTP
jgi:C4-dicarboxylate-binding protein DctP